MRHSPFFVGLLGRRRLDSAYTDDGPNTHNTCNSQRVRYTSRCKMSSYIVPKEGSVESRSLDNCQYQSLTILSYSSFNIISAQSLFGLNESYIAQCLLGVMAAVELQAASHI